LAPGRWLETLAQHGGLHGDPWSAGRRVGRFDEQQSKTAGMVPAVVCLRDVPDQA